ncbi:MAG: hypothetical protein FWE32_08475 [Oscillospiraceae bacterium]|nr:hypothetical protein [Oscillospiraceae bacterium]
MSEWVINQAVVEADICGEVHTFESNLVKIKIRQEAAVRLHAKKVVCGSCLRSGQFKFTVTDQRGKEVAYAHNTRNGGIAFPELTFDRPGTHTYTIQEISRTCGCWILDRRRCRVVVTVHECQQGKLIAAVNYPDGFPVFVNKYCPKPCLCFKRCCEKMCCTRVC